MLLITKTSDIWNMPSTTAAWRRFRRWWKSEAGPEVWKIGVAPALNQPAAAVACVLGIILIVIGRKKKPLIGYAQD